jgi:type VI secretion system protein ImpG
VDRNEHLYRLYQDELQALNEFVMSYSLDHKYAGLKNGQSNDDPDVLRLLEALAFFSARTQDVAQRNITSYRYRLYQQLFPYLLCPVPPFGIMRATHTGALTEPVFLERGTEFVLENDQGSEYFFQTRAPVHVFPIFLREIKATLVAGSSHTISFSIQSRHIQHNVPDQLSFYIDYIGDLDSSYRILGFFRNKIEKARVSYEKETAIERHWIDVPQLAFGSIPLRIDENDHMHPIEIERMFLNDPRGELFLHVSLPTPTHSYNDITIEFDFIEAWPKGLVLNTDIFQLHCIPVVNLKKSPSNPMLIDGSKTQFPILHSQPTSGYTFHKAIGVYRIDGTALKPLVPGILKNIDGSFEIDESKVMDDGRSVTYLNVHFPSAFEYPVTVFVDAMWSQRSFLEDKDRKSNIKPYSRNILGVQWDWIALPKSRASLRDVDNRDDVLLNIVYISQKRYYSYEDMLSIFDVLGPLSQGPFKKVHQAFKGLRYELRSVDGSTLTAGYVLYFMDFNWDIVDHESELFNVFISHLEFVLNSWSSEREIRLSLDLSDDLPVKR